MDQIITINDFVRFTDFLKLIIDIKSNPNMFYMAEFFCLGKVLKGGGETAKGQFSTKKVCISGIKNIESL